MSRTAEAIATEETGYPKRARGRPRSFDRSAALDQATQLFWECGYEGASFDNLIAAMGISPSSFYNAFGSKKRLYEEATEAYLARVGAWFASALGAATDTRNAFHQLLEAGAREFTQDNMPSGCMIALAGTQVSPELASLHEMMAGYRRAAQVAMADRIRRGIDDGDVPAATDAEALAAFYSALAGGMVVKARDGASRERLLEIAEIGMRAWPQNSSTRKSRRS